MSTAGLRTLIRTLDEAMNSVAVAGVINGDEDAYKAAVLNEFGGVGIYEDGKYAGQSVEVPRRPFISDSIDRHEKEILKAGIEKIDFEKKVNFMKALDAMGKKAAELQENALLTNGEGIPGWQKHNSPRTIETKGFDQPLYTRHGTTFPIDYEIIRKGK